MKSAHLLAVASLVTGATICQSPTVVEPSPAFERWISQKFESVNKVTIAKLLNVAHSAGFATSPAETRVLKATLHAMRKDARRTGRNVMLADATATRSPNAPFSRRSAVVETEFNDGPAYAETLLLQPCGSGDNSATGDVDSWRLLSVGNEWITLDVQASGALPIADSVLNLTNDAGQVVATNDDNFNGALSTIELFLPPGLFVANVGSFFGSGGGTYDLVVSRRSATVQAIAPTGALQTFTGTTNTTGPQDVFQIILPNDAQVQITTNSGGGDLRMQLQTSSGTTIYTVDDTAFGTDPAGDFNLPAGQYFLSIADNFASTQPYTLTFQDTTMALPDACATGLTETLVGDESFHLYRAVVAAPSDLSFLVGPGASNPTQDTRMFFFDRDLNPLAYVDDSATGFFANYGQSVPAGLYYVSVSNFPGDFGDYTFDGSCTGTFATQGTIEYGQAQPVNLPDSRGDLYNFSTCTPENVGGFIDFGNGAIMDGTGAALMYFDETLGDIPFGGQTTAVLPAGNHFMVLADAYGGIPALLDFDSSVRCEAGMLTSTGKFGDLAFLFAAFTRNVPGIPVGNGTNGNFCMPIGATVTVGFQSIPASGRVSWAIPCAPTGPALYFVQQADLHTGLSWTPGGRATFRNTLPIR